MSTEAKVPSIQKVEREVISAPLWLKRRMEALQHRPLPTLQTVREQWANSAAFSRRLDDKPKASS